MLALPLSMRRMGASGRRLVAKRPWIYWLVVAALAAWTYSVVAGHAKRLDAARDEWGATAPVVVAGAATAPGEPIVGEVVEWPESLVPPGAVSSMPPGAVARLPIAAGDPLRAADLAAAGALGLVPDGWLAVPISESPASGAAVGDRVQVVSEGVVVAERALVVGFVDDATLVAAPADVAPTLALATDPVLLRVP